MLDRSSAPATRIPAGALPARISSLPLSASMRPPSTGAISSCCLIAVLIAASVHNLADGLGAVLPLHPGAVDAARNADRPVLLVDDRGGLGQHMNKDHVVVLPQLDRAGLLKAMTVPGDFTIGHYRTGPAPRARRDILRLRDQHIAMSPHHGVLHFTRHLSNSYYDHSIDL